MPQVDTLAVIGMGRLGIALALELERTGGEVLAIDSNEEIIQSLNGKVTHAVVADATKEEVLEQLAIPEMECVVVAIGDSVEASVLVTSLLLSFNIPQIWVKAVSEAHGRILHQIGVPHVIYPEVEIGKRLAHTLRGSVKDYIELGDGLAMVRTVPPMAVTEKPISQSHIRSRFGVTIISVKPEDGKWSDVTGDTILHPTDQVLVTGPVAKAEGFHRLQ